MTAFRVGTRVEFIGWNPPWYIRPFMTFRSCAHLEVGGVYTVSRAFNYGFGRRAVDLVERPAPNLEGVHYGYISFFFRPVIHDTSKAVEEIKASLPKPKLRIRERAG